MGYKTIKQISGDKEEPKLMTKYEWLFSVLQS